LDYIKICFEDSSSSIDCAEKYFNLLISALYFKHVKIEKPQLTENQTVLDFFAKLNDFLNLEGQLNRKLGEIINIAKDYFIRGEYYSSFQEINTGFRTYRPLNIHELKRLIKENGNAGDLIKGKDIILLLGETGAGKTTIIQFLLGMKMQEKTIRGMLHIEGDTDEFLQRKYPNGVFDEKIIEKIKNLKSSCFMRSETRYLNPIQIDFDDSFNINSIIICDTPGFRDSNGTEVDIANGISIIKAISMSKSIRPLILISEKGIGDRGQELKRYAKTISSILPDFYDFCNEINIIFTKFKKDDIQNIISKINNLINLPSNKDSSDDALKNFFTLLKKKLERNKKDANKYILDPLNDNPATLLDLIVERTREIEDPGKNFKYFITEESLKDINEQFSIHTNVIDNCLSKNEFEIVKFKLEELKFISKETNNNNLKNKYEDLVKKVLKHIDDVSENCKSELSVLFKLEDEINKDHLEKIRQTYKFIEKIDIFKGKIDDNTLPDKNFFDQCIKKQLKEFENFIEKFKANDFRVYSKIKKIKILSTEFSCFKPMLDIAKSFISNQLKEFEEFIDTIFLDGENSKFDYRKFVEIFENLYELITNYKEIIEKEKTCPVEKNFKKLIQFYQKKNVKCLEFLNNNLIENTSKKLSKSLVIFEETPYGEPTFQKSNNENEGIKTINEFFEEIRIILENPMKIQFEAVDIEKTFKNLETDLKNSIINKFHENYDKIHEKINNKEITDLFEEEDHEKFIKMKNLSDINKTSYELRMKFNDLTKSLQKFFSKILKEIIKSINSPEENNQVIMRKLKGIIDNFQKLKWIEEYNKNAFEEFKERIEENILFNQDKDIDILESSTLTLSNHSDLIEKANSYFRLSNIMDLFSKSDKITSKIKTSIDSFKNSLENIFEDLKKLIADIKSKNPDLRNFNLESKIQGQKNANFENINQEQTTDNFENINQEQTTDNFENINQVQTNSNSKNNCDFPLNPIDLIIFDNPVLQKLKNVDLFILTFRKVNSKIKNNKLFKKIEDSYFEIESILSDFKINNKKIIQRTFDNLRSIISKDPCLKDESIYISNYDSTIQILKRILEFYNKVKVNYENILYFFDPNQEFKDFLISLIREFDASFETEIEKADENENHLKLKILLNFSKIFTMINLVFIDNFQFNFTKHKEKIYEIIKNFIPKYETDFDENLKRSDFNEINETFSRLYGNNKNYQNLQKKLHKNLEDKLNDINNMVDDFLCEDYKIESSKKLAKSYEEINKLLKIDQKYLLKKDEKVEKIKEISDSIRDKFISEIDSLTGVGYINYNIPIDLDSKISNLKKIKANLNNILTSEIEDKKIYDAKFYENISKIEDMIKTGLDDFMKRNSLKEIADYPPLDLISKLKNIKLSSLEQFKKDLQNYLKGKIEEELIKMQECYKTEEFKKMKNNINKCFKYLEEDYSSNHIKDKFNYIQNEFEEKKKADFEEIEKMQNSNDYNSLLNFLDKKKDTINSNLKSDIEKFLSDKINNLTNIAKNENDIVNYFEKYKEILTIKKFNKYFSNINELLNIFMNRLEKYSEEIKKSEKNLDFQFLKEDDETSVNFQYQNVQENYQVINTNLNEQDAKINASNNNDLGEYPSLKNIIITENNGYVFNDNINKKSKEIKEDLLDKTKNIIECFKIINDNPEFQSLKNKNNNLDFRSSSSNRSEEEENHGFGSNICHFSKFIIMSKSLIFKIIKLKGITLLACRNNLNVCDLKKVIFDYIYLYILEEPYSNIINEFEHISKALKLNDEEKNFEKKKISILNITNEIKKKIESESSNFNMDFLNQLQSLMELIKDLRKIIDILKDFEMFKFLPEFKSNTNFYQNMIKNIQNELTKLQKHLKKNMEIINSSSPKTQQEEMFDILKFYTELAKINIDLERITSIHIDDFQSHFKNIFTNKMASLINDKVKNLSIENISEELITLKILLMNNISETKYYNNQFINTLTNIKKTKGIKAISQIGLFIQKHHIGKIISQDYQIFEGIQIYLYNTKTSAHGVNYVLDNLLIEGGNKINDDEKKILLGMYNLFSQQYDKLLKMNMNDASHKKYDNLINSIKQIFNQKSSKININNKVLSWKRISEEIPVLLAHIFCLWTLKNSSSYFEMSREEESKDYLLRPHAVQVLSIFMVLNFHHQDENKKKLLNHLVQIKTGEGKSVILGVLSTFFALFGINIYVACYSKYLSDRDLNYFSDIFQCLGISDKIKYGTFNNLCENLLKIKLDIRACVENFAKNGIISNLDSNSNECRNILLIDEVDVFFSKEFNGNIYIPSIRLTDPTISSLIDKLWNEKNNNFNGIHNFKNWNEYLACVNKFNKIADLIEPCFLNAVSDLMNFKDHSYILKNNQIGYKEQDNVVFNVNYGYKTLFAYYDECSKGNISPNILSDKKALIIKCAQFAYAEIPKHFNDILGVTGTLDSLNSMEKDIIKNNYNITKKTFSPSAYGNSQFKFDENSNFNVTNQNDYFKLITDNIERGLQGKLPGTKRAILVFFENSKKLYEFFESNFYSKFKTKTKIITEEIDYDEKVRYIKLATLTDSITLLTRIFGRGTDFISNDDIVINQGGVHVIQTFFSDNLSEEIQIKGRTARQGQTGTYEMILLENDLEKFGYQYNLITATINYQQLNRLRQEFVNKEYDLHKKLIEESLEEDKKSHKFIEDLKKQSKNEIINYLIKINCAANLNKIFSVKSRIIILIDATGSMATLLNYCKIVIEKMFDRINEILNEKNIKNGFEIQLSVYRNYNVPVDDVLQFSTWESKPDNLRNFLRSVTVKGGMGEEAIEVGLHHVNHEDKKLKVTKVILIGDMPSNTKEMTINKRKTGGYGESYWNNTQYANCLDYKVELNNIKNRVIPINTFYLTSRAKTNFEEIATNTNGKCDFLDVQNNSQSDEVLTNMICHEILENVAHISGIDPNILKNAYNQRFVKSYNN